MCCSYSGCCLEGETISNPNVSTLTVASRIVASAEEEGREPRQDHRKGRRAEKGNRLNNSPSLLFKVANSSVPPLEEVYTVYEL